MRGRSADVDACVDGCCAPCLTVRSRAAPAATYFSLCLVSQLERERETHRLREERSRLFVLPETTRRQCCAGSLLGGPSREGRRLAMPLWCARRRLPPRGTAYFWLDGVHDELVCGHAVVLDLCNGEQGEKPCIFACPHKVRRATVSYSTLSRLKSLCIARTDACNSWVRSRSLRSSGSHPACQSQVSKRNAVTLTLVQNCRRKTVIVSGLIVARARTARSRTHSEFGHHVSVSPVWLKRCLVRLTGFCKVWKTLPHLRS